MSKSRQKITAYCMLSAMLLTGCSSNQLLYRNADWLLTRWVGGMLDASSAQREDWQVLMERVMADHRRDLAPRLVVLLSTLASNAERGFSADELTCWAEQMHSVYRAHAARAVVPASIILSEISPGQVEHLAAQLEEQNAEFRDRYLDPDLRQRTQARTERYLERITYFTGELSAAQIELVENNVSAIRDVTPAWLAYREAQQARLLELLRGRADRSRLQTFLTAWWVQSAGRPAALVDQMDNARTAIVAMLLELQQTLTSKQARHLVDELRDLRDDLRAVSATHAAAFENHDGVSICIETAAL